MAEIRWSVTAGEDLRQIETTVARDSPIHAVRLTERLVDAVERLEAFPLSGRSVPEFDRDDLREVICGSYRVVYLAGEDRVTILRVVHGARDILGLARREPWESVE
jgi:plasmid stabilization system protein ParE